MQKNRRGSVEPPVCLFLDREMNPRPDQTRAGSGYQGEPGLNYGELDLV